MLGVLLFGLGFVECLIIFSKLNKLNNRTQMLNLVQQNLGEFQEDLELDFKLFFFVDSGSTYIVLEKSE